jgi:hypothetical protein
MGESRRHRRILRVDPGRNGNTTVRHRGDRHKAVYRFLARENCQFDAQPTEDAEKQRLQREHRDRLRTPGGPIYYEFSTHEELRVLILSIDELRELVRPRRARIPFLPMHEKFTGRRQFLETLQQDLTAELL